MKDALKAFAKRCDAANEVMLRLFDLANYISELDWVINEWTNEWLEISQREAFFKTSVEEGSTGLTLTARISTGDTVLGPDDTYNPSSNYSLKVTLRCSDMANPVYLGLKYSLGFESSMLQIDLKSDEDYERAKTVLTKLRDTLAG